MKKLLFLMFLMMTTLSFANTGKIVKHTKTNAPKTVYTCTVGGFTCTGHSDDAAVCACARGKYCKAHNCNATPAPTPQN